MVNEALRALRRWGNILSGHHKALGDGGDGAHWAISPWGGPVRGRKLRT